MGAAVFAAFCIFLSSLSGAEQSSAAEPPQQIKAFQPGESLTYVASWSETVKMGTAVMEVRSEKLGDGREGLRFVMTSRTEGAIGSLYPLGEDVESVFDPATMQTLSFNSTETQGKKVRRRKMEFDHEHKTASVRKNEDPVKTFPIPDRLQDNLSSIYFLRTREDFTIGKPITFEAFDGEKSWLIEVQVLGREKVKTPAGEFDTIKVKAYKGFLMSEGEVTIWLTDDIRRIPVLIKGKIKIGSIVFTLTGFKPGRSS